MSTVVTCGSMEIEWYSDARLALLRFSADTKLDGTYGGVLVDALRGWIGASAAPFALLADASRVLSTDAQYRAVTAGFFGPHRGAARIALINVGPLIRVVAEMFRVAMRLQLKAFPDEAAARAWLRVQGIAA